MITLGVIGIVAAIALPSLINHYNDKVLETKYKKTKSLLINGYKLMMAKDQLFDISQLEFMSDFENKAAEAHKEVFKILSDTKGGLDAETLPKDYTIEDNDSPSEFNWVDVSYAFQTTDGMLYGIEQDEELNNLYIYADVNGASSPNTVGKDLYKFSISGNGLLADVSSDLTEIPCSIDNPAACKTPEECFALANNYEDGPSGPCTEAFKFYSYSGCKISNFSIYCK